MVINYSKMIVLTDVIKIWEELNIKDTGDIGFCDLEKAIDKICSVKNDIDAEQPNEEKQTKE